MKLPDAFNQFLHKTPQQEEVYLSLVLEMAAIQAAVWTLGSGKKAKIGEAAQERVEADSWEKRSEACDRAIAKIAQKSGRDDFEKVVLGLPAYYLSPEDDISDDARGSIKTLTSELELTPIGFVPIHQAVVHQIKEEEGVPPSVILLEVGHGTTTVLVYKVGALVARENIANDDLVPELERTLRGLKDLEVLPSRILLYGSDEAAIETYKRDLLKHPWPTRANFLHYPKIEILATLALSGAVSRAGSSELAGHIGEVAPKEEPVREEVLAVDQNVVEVSPETLGFKRGVDVLEKPVEEDRERGGGEEEVELEEGKRVELKETLSRFISGVKLPKAPKVSMPKMGIVVAALFLLFIAGIVWTTYWVLPKVSITILQLPQVLSETSSVTVSPTATVVDPTNTIVPGRKQEKTVSGEKTIAVTGQKDIGDPARGTVTVYNKTLTSKKLPKGTVLTAGSLSFTLDSDVSIASASESVGSITFGKANAAITAAKLGLQSNLPASTEFSFKDTPSSVMIARNEAALSGGTSKVVTVISRADQDGLIEALTTELIEKAKDELAQGVGGRERLIDATIKTAVTDKSFDAEPGTEAKELHGKITVTVSGTSYSEEDVASLFADLVAAKVPSGYTLRSGAAKLAASNVKVQKDGTITVAIEYQGQALPTFDIPSLQAKLAGKSLREAEGELRVTPGVGGIMIGEVSRSLWGASLPVNAKNIFITTDVLE